MILLSLRAGQRMEPTASLLSMPSVGPSSRKSNSSEPLKEEPIPSSDKN
jgi:hypothetical protein